MLSWYNFSGTPPVDIDLDFWEDITGNINGTVNFVGEARKNSYGVVLDMVYSDIDFKESTPGPYFSEVSSQTKTWIVSTAGLYRIIDNPANYVDLLAGVRYWSVESTLGGSDFFISGTVLIGGFGIGSELMWNAALNLGYNWTKSVSSTIRYRYLDVDYDSDGFIYDVNQDGPSIGFSWGF